MYAAISRSGSAQWARRLGRSRREWAADSLLTLAGFGLGVLLLLATMTDDPAVGDHVTSQVLGGVAAAVAFLVFRRIYPALLAVLFVPTGFVFITVSGLAFASFFTVAAFRTARIALLVTGLHAAFVLVLFRIETEAWSTYWQGAGTFLFLDIVALTSGMLVRSHRMLISSLEERARQAEKEQRLRVDEARHLERERIAREMHDVLAHRISLLAVHAGALEFRPGASAGETRAAGVIRQSAHDALEDLRDVIRMLRRTDSGGDTGGGGSVGHEADSDRPQPTLTDLPALVEQSRRTGTVVDFDFDIEPDGTARRREPAAAGAAASARVDADAELAADDSAYEDGPSSGVPVEVRARLGRHAYRIVQEGLTNARKHAPGEPVRIRVDTGGTTGMRIEIANPLHSSPAPHNPIPGSGTGLIGLRERVNLVGGRLEHGADSGEFRLWAWLPWTP